MFYVYFTREGWSKHYTSINALLFDYFNVYGEWTNGARLTIPFYDAEMKDDELITNAVTYIPVYIGQSLDKKFLLMRQDTGIQLGEKTLQPSSKVKHEKQ